MLHRLGSQLQEGIEAALSRAGTEAFVSRIGSGLCVYFMPHQPRDWHDLATNHDFAADLRLRRALIDSGVYVFPLAAKQWSISAAHTAEDIEQTLDVFARNLEGLSAVA